MSEKLASPHEQEPRQAAAHERPAREIAHEKVPESANGKSVEKIRRSVEQHSVPSETIQKQHLDNDKPAAHVPTANRHVKKHALDQTLRQVRRQLPRRERQLSKFIHNSAVEQISTAASETIARPSGLLVGGLFSLLSSLGLLIICYRYGYSYNFLIAIAFFGGGFIAGIVLEAIVRAVRR